MTRQVSSVTSLQLHPPSYTDCSWSLVTDLTQKGAPQTGARLSAPYAPPGSSQLPPLVDMQTSRLAIPIRVMVYVHPSIHLSKFHTMTGDTTMGTYIYTQANQPSLLRRRPFRLLLPGFERASRLRVDRCSRSVANRSFSRVVS